MFLNCLVNTFKSKLNLTAFYSTTVTKSPSKFISSLLAPRKKDEPIHVKFELVKSAEIDPTLQFLAKNYFKEDPLCRSLCINTSKEICDGPMQVLLKDSLRHGMTIIAREGKENEIVGACINNRNCPWDAQKLEEFAKQVQDGNTKKLLYIWALMSREPKIHQELALNSIFEIAIVAIHHKFICRGIGTELVKRSLDLGRDLNFSYARMDCTSDYSIKIAEKLNMKRLWDVSYKNIFMQDGKTPLVVPEYPHSQAAVYYTHLKEQSEEKKSTK
ncbi:arylalkylamine N-acetyltransferase-like 2 [Chironomus tepperi]|uniref:arylalkylamine N-acetyltransferase-like 2 n=1 Tax=Chironomus tepperi TaxID=113505 RepID=UPI00391F0778